MAKKEKEVKETPIEEVIEETPAEEVPEVNPFEEKYNTEHDAYLRLAAEFDNFRKRTIKEKEASYGNGKADAVAKLQGLIPECVIKLIGFIRRKSSSAEAA